MVDGRDEGLQNHGSKSPERKPQSDTEVIRTGRNFQNTLGLTVSDGGLLSGWRMLGIYICAMGFLQIGR